MRGGCFLEWGFVCFGRSPDFGYRFKIGGLCGVFLDVKNFLCGVVVLFFGLVSFVRDQITIGIMENKYEELGQAIDSLDSVASGLVNMKALPNRIHVEGLRGSLPDIEKRIAAAYQAIPAEEKASPAGYQIHDIMDGLSRSVTELVVRTDIEEDNHVWRLRAHLPLFVDLFKRALIQLNGENPWKD